MLNLVIPPREFFDNETNQFFYSKEYKLQLEHSLISVKKWESKWKKSFIDTMEKTPEEMLDYIRMMTLTPNPDPKAYQYLTKKNIEEIKEYIEDPMTATTFGKELGAKMGGKKRKVTSEVIYSWMFTLGIPMECQKWHLNQLMTMIRVMAIKNGKKPKPNQKEAVRDWAKLNKERRERYNTKG